MYPNKLHSIKDFEMVLMEMGGALSWEYDRPFFKAVKNLDNTVLKIFFKQVEKIFDNPYRHKHMSSDRKGMQELYVASSYRLYYTYFEKDNRVVFIEFSHKDDQ